MAALRTIQAEHISFLPIVAFTAGEAIVEDKMVYLKSDGKVYLTNGATNVPLGTCRTTVQNDGTATAANDIIEVALFFPIRRALSGGTCTIGQLLECDADGDVVDATTDGNNWVVGQCLRTAAVGEVTFFVPVMTADTDDVSAVIVD